MQNAEMKVVRFDNDDIITTSVSGYAVVSGLVNGTVMETQGTVRRTVPCVYY